MAALRAFRRAQVLGQAVADIARDLFRPKAVVKARDSLRAECERLEDRRLLSYVFSGGSGWTFYGWYGYSLCDCPTPTVTLHGHTMLVTGDANSLNITESTFPVRWGDGRPIISSTDLSSDGFGKTWDLTRTWNGTAITGQNNAGKERNPAGNHWDVSGMPQLVYQSQGASDIIAIDNGNVQTWFNRDGSGNNYTALGSHSDKLVPGSNHDFARTDDAGGVTKYYNFDSSYWNGTSHPTAQMGQLESYTYPDGSTTVTTSYDSNGNLTEVRRTSGNTVESYHYIYSDPNYSDLISAAVLRRSTDGGTTWNDVREADYSYYTSGASFGNAKDLKTVTLRVGAGSDSTPGTGAVIGTTCYRYDTTSDQLTQVFDPESYARAVAGGYDPALSTVPDSATLQGYASNYFTYGSGLFYQSVVEEIAQAAGCSCPTNGGQGTYDYSYTLYPVGTTGYASTYSDDYNHWKMKVVETMPDHSTETVYSNFAGQAMLQDVYNPTTGLHADTYYRYDNNGNVIMLAHPSAVSGYDEHNVDLVGFNTSTGNALYLNDNTGLIETYDYYGWSFAGTSGVTNGTGIASSPAPSAGSQMAYVKQTGSFSQTVTGWSAGSYTLSISSAQGAANPSDESLIVLVDGKQVDTYIPTTSFASHTTPSFSVTAGPHTIQILGSPGGPSDADYAFVDTMSVTSGGPAIDDASFEDAPVGTNNSQVHPSGYATSATTSTGGGVAGYNHDSYVQQGEAGTPTLTATADFLVRNTAVAGTSISAFYFPLADKTDYGSSGGGDPRKTSYAYTWLSGNQPQSITTTYPPITTTQNGPASSNTDTAHADVEVDWLNNYGQVVWQKNGDGFLSYTNYDLATGAVVKQISDVNTADTSDFSGLPTGWTTPTGGGAELITSMAVDGLGRITELSSPNANAGTNANAVTYTVYNDATHEVRVYPGYSTTSHTTTSPVQISREYYPTTSEPTLYFETMTSSAAPSYDLTTGVPTGTETISAPYIQSLSRQLTNNGGQVYEQDDYANLTGVTYSQTSLHLGTAFYARTDLLDQGTWQGVFGGEGNVIAGDSATNPSYVTPSFTRATPSTWSGASTSDAKLLQDPAGGTHSTSYWSSSTNFVVDLNITGGLAHQVTFYMIDWDNSGRSQQVDVRNGTTGALLNTATFSSFSQGQYITFTLSGHVQVVFTNLAGSTKTAVLSGILFDSAGNYYPTRYHYDDRGRQDAVYHPTGTIDHTVYDGQGRVIANYVGTDDQPSAGNDDWSPSTQGPASNMMDVTDYAYDQPLAFQAPPSAPTLTEVSSGSLPGNTYYVVVTYVNATGETLASSESPQLVDPNYVLHVASPSSVGTATGYNVYVSTSSGTEVKQNSSPITLGTAWQEPTTGLTAGLSDLPGMGDSNLSQVTAHPGASQADRVSQMLYDYRDRPVFTKQALKMSSGYPSPSGETDGVHRPATYTVYDNLNEATGVYQYDADGIPVSDFVSNASTDATPTADAGRLRAYSKYSYDDQGRVYLSQVFSVDQSSGSVSSSALSTNTFYDHRGNTAAVYAPGGLATQYVYDGADRVIKTSQTDGGQLAGAAMSWTNAADSTLANEVVLEQTLTSYDADSNPIFVTTKQRYDTDTTTTTGDLGSPSSGLFARDYYTAYYYDASDRPTAVVDAGTDGGSVYSRPSSVPTGSPTLLVTQTAYNVQGLPYQVTDPRGIITLTTYDMLGRATQVIAASDGGSPTNTTDQTTNYTYDGDDHVLTMQAVMPTGTPSQTTAYIYGVGGTAGTSLFSNDLIANVEYPNKSTGVASPSASDDQSYAYDLLGEAKTYTDQNGTVHTYTYDPLGRMTLDAATTLGTGVFNTVRSQGYAFDTAGRLFTATTYSNTGGTTALNQVENLYNGLGQLTTQYQEHSGTVNTSTSQKVQYGYNDPSLGGRLANMTYPNGRTIDYAYGSSQAPISSITYSYDGGTDTTTATVTTASNHNLSVGDKVVIQGAAQAKYDGTFTIATGNILSATSFKYTFSGNPGANASGSDMTAAKWSLDNAISRLSSIQDHAAVSGVDSPGTVLEGYVYLGLGMIVQRTHPQPGVNLTYEASDPAATSNPTNDGGDQYTGLNRFGEVVDQNYVNPSTGVSTERFQYGYDEAGNVLYKNNLKGPSFSELYHNNSSAVGDNNTGSTKAYDPLNRLQAFRRGTLSASGNNGTNGLDTITTGNLNSAAGSQKVWTLDALGNQSSVQTDGGTAVANTFNSQNQETAAPAAGSHTISYDNDGNITTDQNGNTYSYDAWGHRMVYTLTGASQCNSSYSYDALGRRVVANLFSTSDNNFHAHDLYYAGQRMVEEHYNAGTTSYNEQYVWGEAYVNDLVLRDQSSTTGGTTTNSRLYAQQDANWNVTSLIDTSGTVQARFIYDSYGQVQSVTTNFSGVNTSWTPATDSSQWLYYFQGGRYDVKTGLIEFQNRDYSPVLGRWFEADPTGGMYVDGANLYQMELSNPVNRLDPSGLESLWYYWGRAAEIYNRAQQETYVATYKGSRVVCKSLLNVIGYDRTKKGWQLRRRMFQMESTLMMFAPTPGAVPESPMEPLPPALPTVLPTEPILPLNEPVVAPELPPAFQLKAGDTHGFAAETNEALAAARLEAYKAAQQFGRKHATYVGGTKGGKVVVGKSSNPCGCGEDDVTRMLGPGARFTKAWGWRYNPKTLRVELTEIPVCTTCQNNYNQDQFPPDVSFDSGGTWSK